MTARVVGVFPPRARALRRRLFDALELAFPIRFEGRDQGDFGGLDAAVFVDAPAPTQRPPCPSLWFERGDVERPQNGKVRLSSDTLLDGRLRGRVLTDGEADAAPVLRPSFPARVLAATANGPVWVTSQDAGPPRRYLAAFAPAELEVDEPLRARFRSGSFIGLLPLVHLLREINTEWSWSDPPPRACFIIDDPNLHSLTYGHVDFRRLVAHAARGGYHVAIASTPIDYGFVHPAARALFAAHTGQISLAVHGNNHERHELSGVRSEAEALAIAAQAIRRSERLERQSGLRVPRVMCAPHEECGRLMQTALFRLGFDALCKEPSWRVSHDADNPEAVLTGWEPAQTLAGLPVLPRYRLLGDEEDLVFRSYLNLPILLYFHHWDLAGGPEVLDAAADLVNRVRPHDWMSLADLCRSNVVSRRTGETLVVRPYARRVSVRVDADVRRIVVEAAPSEPPVEVRVSCGSLSTLGLSGRSLMIPGPFASRAEIEMVSAEALSDETFPPPPPRMWPAVRRAMTESRDRLGPLSDRLWGRPASR
ncbi:MAG: hypothetical protein E6J18_12600 [Chloroflexi bacterium]|nr:MAG: hypothetical protein E6J18_12600 [Chloroflexota bacterium]